MDQSARYADLSLNEQDLMQGGRHILVAYKMKPKSGHGYLEAAAHFAAESSTGTNVEVSTTDEFTKGVDALVYYIDEASEDMRIAYPIDLFDRMLSIKPTDERKTIADGMDSLFVGRVVARCVLAGKCGLAEHVVGIAEALRFEFARSASSKAKTWLLAGPGSPRCLLVLWPAAARAERPPVARTRRSSRAP